MRHKNYKNFIRSQRFRSYAEIVTHDGMLLWGVSKNDRAFILHDSCGQAFLGLQVGNGELINIDGFKPVYKGTILKYTHMTIDNVRFQNVIHEQGSTYAWGVYGMIEDKHHLVTDCFGRVYTGLVTQDGETVDARLIVPSYFNKILLPYPMFDIKAG